MHLRSIRYVLNVFLAIVLVLSGVTTANANIANVNAEIEVVDQSGKSFQDCSKARLFNGILALQMKTSFIDNGKQECRYGVTGQIDTRYRDFFQVSSSLFCQFDNSADFRRDFICASLTRDVRNLQDRDAKFLIPSVSQFQIQVKFSDGTPAANLSISKGGNSGRGSCDFAVMDCSYEPVFHSSNFERDYRRALSFKTDANGFFTVNLPNTFARNGSIRCEIGGCLVSP
ncbi:MAG: hypothetical protein RL228_357, partial [Actinomycetota bacterium]